MEKQPETAGPHTGVVDPAAADPGADPSQTASGPPPEPTPPESTSVPATTTPLQPVAALPPVWPWVAAALLGMGATFDHTVAGVNPLGFGFGVRGSYLALEPWAFGARLVYFVGGSSDLPTGRISMQSWVLAAEGAYVMRLHPVIIQPGLLFGLHVREIDNRLISVDLPSPDLAPGRQNKTQVGLYLAPGVNVMLPLSVFSSDLDYLFAGADVRLDLALGSRVTGNLQLLFQAGLRF